MISILNRTTNINSKLFIDDDLQKQAIIKQKPWLTNVLLKNIIWNYFSSGLFYHIKDDKPF